MIRHRERHLIFLIKLKRVHECVYVIGIGIRTTVMTDERRQIEGEYKLFCTLLLCFNRGNTSYNNMHLAYAAIGDGYCTYTHTNTCVNLFINAYRCSYTRIRTYTI